MIADAPEVLPQAIEFFSDRKASALVAFFGKRLQVFRWSRKVVKLALMAKTAAISIKNGSPGRRRRRRLYR